jgi:membrane associated rhomboid family serine protease
MSNFRYTRPDSFPPIVKNLVIINGLVYLAQLLLEKQYALTSRLVLWPIMPERLHKILVDAGKLDESEKFQPYQVVTHMFSHAPPPMIFHIIFNMLVLWMFGRVLENIWGPKRFLFFYLACGVGAAALHLGIQYFRCEQLLQSIDANNAAEINARFGAVAPALGASGAIMGIMVAFAYLFPNTELMIIPIPIPIKAKWLVLAYVLLDLFLGFGNVGDNIAHFAHLGGAITGFLIVFIWNKTNRRTLY